MSETAAPPATPMPANLPDATPSPSTADARSWLPEEYREDKAFAKFKDIGSLAKGYRETVSFVGADKNTLLKLPQDEAAPEWSEVWNKLGRPETPAGYTFEGLDDFPAEALDGFRSAAHAAGLPAKQATALAKWYADHQGQQREALRTDAEASLRKEWGATFDERIHSARKVMDQFGGDEVRDFIERSGFGNHAAVIRMFAKVAEQIAEPGALKGGQAGAQPGPSAMTPAEARAEIDTLRADREFMDKYFRRDAEAVKRMRHLWDMAAPAGQ